MSMNFGPRHFEQAREVDPLTARFLLLQSIDDWFPRLPWDSLECLHDRPGMPGRWRATKAGNVVFMDHSDFGMITGQESAHDLDPLDVIAFALDVDYDEGAIEWVARQVPWLIYEPASPPEPPAGTQAFRRASDLAAEPVPPREWHVRDMIPHGTATLLTGDGGTGKSMLAMQLAVAGAAGARWIGRDVARGPVIYLSAEDDADELHRRLDGILAASDLSYGNVSDLYMRSTVGEGALLAEKGRESFKPSALAREIEAFAGQVAARLIVLDTLANLYPGDENDRAQVTQFVDIVKGIAVRRDCSVLVLAHPSKSAMDTGEGYSGSTAWNGAFRSRLFLKRVLDNSYEADTDARVLRTAKANYGPVGGELALTYSGGVFVAKAAETGLDRMAAGAKAERVFLELLELFTSQGRRVNAKGGSSYAPNVFAAHPKSEGVTKKALRAAMEALLASGKARVSEEGPPSRRVSFIELGGA